LIIGIRIGLLLVAVKMKLIGLLVLITILSVIFSCVDAKRKKVSNNNNPPAAAEIQKDNAYESGRPLKAKISNSELAKSAHARAQRAKQLHAEGIKFAMDGKYNEALPHMRAAVRMDPYDIGFVNDLGVTEMRMGQYQKAKSRFLKVLELDPNFETGNENIAEIKKYMNDEEFNLGQGKFPQKHRLSEPKEVDANEFMSLTVDDDVRNPGYLGDEPFVIRGAAQAWGWDKDKITLDHIKTKYGNRRADYYPHNMKEENVNPMFLPLYDSVDQLTLPMEGYMGLDTSLPGTYIQWNIDEEAWRGLLDDMGAELPQLFEDKHWTSQCLSEDNGVSTFNRDIHWKMMLIGEKDAGMFNHKDVMRMASWQVQLTGRKLWHICSPSQDPYVYKAGEVNTFKPDYHNYPKMINATCFQAITNAGDAMYYPRDWWHQTQNLETPSIAFSGSMINKHCHKEFGLKLLQQCGTNGGHVFRATPEHCSKLRECIRYWDRTYEHGTGILPTLATVDPEDKYLKGESQHPTKKAIAPKKIEEKKNIIPPIKVEDNADDEDIPFHDEM
jgi:tetratricopeptide (TPR) repeat protein